MTLFAYDYDTTSPGRPRASGVQVGRGEAAAEALALYSATSALPMHPWTDAVLPAELHDYLSLVYAAAEQPLLAVRDDQPTRQWGTVPAPTTTPGEKRLVLFTGGKDSLSAALRVQAAGYTPVLYHVAGLNRGMGDEPGYAQAIAQYAGWDLHIDRIKVSGTKNGLMELPTKNQVTALLALDRMLEWQLPGAFVAGWHRSDEQHKQHVGYDFSDGVDAIALFDAYMRARVPQVRYESMLYDTTEAWATVAAAGMLAFIKGCVCPVRYKKRVRAANQRKYGPLLPSRCGACVKCAWEQVALEELGVLEPNPALRKAQEKYIMRDFGPERLGPGTTLADAIEFLVPAAEVDKWRRPRAQWPVQVQPADLGLGQPHDVEVDA